jgi:outer membrane putative beta-barrel porin/alpha-amylase
VNRILLTTFALLWLTNSVVAESESLDTPSREILREEFSEKDSPFVITATDLGNGQVKFENDFIYERSRDGEDTFQIPVLLRIDTGPETEFRLRHDFLTYSDPNLGFGDTTVGFKWAFLQEENQNLAIVGDIELPIGSAGFEADALEYFGVLAYDHDLGSKWLWSLNLNAASLVGEDLVRFTAIGFATQFAYRIGEDEISVGVEIGGPDERIDGTTLASLNVGYAHNVGPGSDFTVNLGRRLSGKGSNFTLVLGFGQTF